MAVCIKSVCRVKDQDFIKAWIQQRFLTSRPNSLSAKRPGHVKCTMPSFKWNSCLESRKYTQNYYSAASFHHLALNILICDVAYFPNMVTRFAKDDGKLPFWEKHWDGIKEVYVNEKLEKEMARLRRKGVMKDIPTKTPEGTLGMGGGKKN